MQQSYFLPYTCTLPHALVCAGTGVILLCMINVSNVRLEKELHPYAVLRLF